MAEMIEMLDFAEDKEQIPEENIDEAASDDDSETETAEAEEQADSERSETAEPMPEEANQVGYETAMRWTKGKHAVIVATHIDKAHIHNHIYFNSVSLDCSHKHRDRKRSAKDIARLSDLICIEHQLSTVDNPQHKNTSYAKWEGYTPYLSHRDLLRNDIDEIINKNKHYEHEFQVALRSEQG